MPLTIVTVLMPFYKSADTLSRFRGHPFTIPRTPIHDSADILARFRGHPYSIPRTPVHDSADTLTRFRGHPYTIPRISSAIPRKNCGFPTRTIRGFRKVSCDKYCMFQFASLPAVSQVTDGTVPYHNDLTDIDLAELFNF